MAEYKTLLDLEPHRDPSKKIHLCFQGIVGSPFIAQKGDIKGDKVFPCLFRELLPNGKYSHLEVYHYLPSHILRKFIASLIVKELIKGEVIEIDPLEIIEGDKYIVFGQSCKIVKI